MAYFYKVLLIYCCLCAFWQIIIQTDGKNVTAATDSEENTTKFAISLNDSTYNFEYESTYYQEINTSQLDNQSTKGHFDLETKTEVTYVPAFPLLETEQAINETQQDIVSDRNQTLPLNVIRISSDDNSTNLDTVHLKDFLYIMNICNSSIFMKKGSDISQLVNNIVTRNTSQSQTDNQVKFEKKSDLECFLQRNCILRDRIFDIMISDSQDSVLKYNMTEFFYVHCPVSIPKNLTNKIDIRFSVLIKGMEHNRLFQIFELLLRQALQDKNCSSVTAISFIYGNPHVYSWTNASVNHRVCDNTLDIIQSKIFNGTSVNSIFTEVFLPYFKIENVTITRLGKCRVGTEEASTLPIYVAALFALTIFPCLFLTIAKLRYDRKRKNREKDPMLEPRCPAILNSDFRCAPTYSSNVFVQDNPAFEPEEELTSKY